MKKRVKDGRQETVKAHNKRVALPPKKGDFPIASIGASAGGPEALEQFLSRAPAQSGMAFVIIQHPDPTRNPTRKGIMPELLQRATAMKVTQATDRAVAAGPGLSLGPGTVSALEKVIILLRNHSGGDFSLYKKNAVYRRIERRMGIHRIDKIASYVRLLQESPHELELLFKELLIGVTSFFRDPDAWKALKEKAIPALFKESPAVRPLKAWVAGCSTGEEAYSLAIAFTEAMEETKHARRFSLRIFATDLDRDAIERARQGFYADNIAADVPADRLSRFFIKEGDGYRVSKDIRQMVVFAEQNVIMDPPFTGLDILMCRNLLIYLTPEAQRKLMSLFHYGLNPGGILFLGNAETVGASADLFAPLSGAHRLYKRVAAADRTEPVEFPSSFVHAPPDIAPEPVGSRPAVNLQALAASAFRKAENDRENLLSSTETAALFLDNNLRVRRFTSPMTRIIKLIPGDVDRPITDLAGDLDYPDMARDARKALDTPAFMEKEVDACDGRRFTVRIMPYRAWDKRIGGVVVAFIDVSVSRAREIKLREALPGRPKENP